MISNERMEKAIEDIEALKKELGELKTDHAAVIKELRRSILGLQQIVSLLKINSDANDFCRIITDTPKIQDKQSVQTQVLAEASAIKQKIIRANNPNKMVSEYREKWTNFLRSHGADFVTY